MHYRSKQAYAVRICGGRQVLSVAKKGADEKHLHRIALKAKAELQRGRPLDEVKVLAKHYIEKLG
eukprot:9572047-Alexandrium_andersonii.AAC.1